MVEPEVAFATLDDIMHSTYWEDEQNQTRWRRKWDVKTNRNGHWMAAGHLFKVLYAFHRLAKRIEDKQKVRLCGMILLERYLNPDVQGG